MFCHRSIPAGMAIQNRLDVWTNPGDAWSLLRVSHIFHLVILMIIIFYTYQWYSIFDRIYITVWYYTYQCPFGNVKKHTVGVVHRSIRVACLFSFFCGRCFLCPLVTLSPEWFPCTDPLPPELERGVLMWAKGETEPTMTPSWNTTTKQVHYPIATPQMYHRKQCRTLSLSLKKSQAKLVVIRTQKKEQILVLFVGIRNPNNKYKKMQRKEHITTYSQYFKHECVSLYFGGVSTLYLQGPPQL